MRVPALIVLCVAIVVLLLPDAQASTSRSAQQLHRDFLCIHKYEGSWTARTGNGYYGGLQMDKTFERTYGLEFVEAWGHADRWPAGIQIAVAMRAYLSGRGFGPWPNTRKKCHL